MKLTRLAMTLATVSVLTACGGGSSGSDSAVNVDNVRKVLNTNADIAYAAYSDAVTTATALKDAIDDLSAAVDTYNTARAQVSVAAADPNYTAMVTALANAKTAWLVAREPYGQTEVFRFRLSPIDSTDYESEDGPEGDINAWPLGEALIDYVQTSSGDEFDTSQIGVTANQAGINGNGAIDKAHADSSPRDNIIGNTAVTIDADLLTNTATADDERDVIAGYHAIEFLLWGQDLNDNYEVTDGTDRDEAVKTHDAANLASGGQRPLSDFYEDTYGARRLTYLQVAAAKLVEDLTAVRDGWASGAEYRTAFTTISSQAQAKQKLAEILTGMGTLSEGELAGERMQIAFASNSQEHEHSCFSDNTHRDIAMDAKGVANSYYGEYEGYDSNLDGVIDADDTDGIANAVSGYGVADLLADAGLTDLASQMVTALTTTETNYTAIDAKARAGEPFDVQIMAVNLNATNPVYKTIKSLNAQSGIIAEVADALDLDAEVVDEDASGCDTSDPTTEC
ncbi:imelysin family protein [Thalassolituus sp. LLYu03]|uniref:imelysin family protein n=1 Tax=Thalassolituus sp. LLYu03 TaxID=3421656 RepID=UPI003D27642E